MSHEQSETVQGPDGSWMNVYGRATPQAGQQLPGTPRYSSLDEAVSAAKARSASFSHDEPSRLSDFLDRAYGVAMTPLPRIRQLSEEELARLKSGLGALIPDGPRLPEQLPQMPEWVRRYAIERGLIPGAPQ